MALPPLPIPSLAAALEVRILRHEVKTCPAEVDPALEAFMATNGESLNGDVGCPDAELWLYSTRPKSAGMPCPLV